jgi:L-iditol 2-dehydrogenase
MRAVVWSGPFDLALKEVPVPTPKSGEVLVKTEVVGICGSDIEIYNGRFKQSVPPMIIGHEGGGYVQAVGEGVRSVKPGDRVIVECVLSCGRCEYCKQGRFGLCESGGVLGMVGAQGEYAEYFVAPEKNCHRLPDEISWPEAGLIDTLAGPEYAVSRLLATGYAGRSGDEPGCPATWAVFGPGPAGLFFCALAKIRGARRVFLVGTRDYRLEYGPQFGADVLVHAGKENPVDVIRSGTGGKGAEVVIEAAGSETALSQCFRSVKKGGYVFIYGVFGGGPVPLDVQPIQYHELVVHGTANVLYPPAIEHIRKRAIRVDNLVTHRLTLEELPEAFARGLIEKKLDNFGRYMKGVVMPNLKGGGR